MCLAVPAKLVRVEGEDAVADLHGNRVQVCTALVPEAVVGDWVLLHAGFAIQRLDEQAACENWNVLRDLSNPAGDPDADH